MFARVKKSRNGEYLQIVEAKRVDGKPRQRLALYVGPYQDVGDALERMPRELRSLRSRATRLRRTRDAFAVPEGGAGREQALRFRAEAEKRADAAGEAAESTARRLERLRALVEGHPELLSGCGAY